MLSWCCVRGKEVYSFSASQARRESRGKKSLIFEKWQLLISNLGNYIPRNNSQELVTNSFHQNKLLLVLGERDFACYRVWNERLVKGFNYKVFQRDLMLQLPLKGRDESKAFEKLCWWGSSKEISWIIQLHVLHLSLLTADVRDCWTPQQHSPSSETPSNSSTPLSSKVTCPDDLAGVAYRVQEYSTENFQLQLKKKSLSTKRKIK